MENGQHNGPERIGVFRFGGIARRCDVRAMPQLVLLAVLDTALQEAGAIMVDAHPELACWPAGDEQWLHDDYVLYNAFSLSTMVCSLCHIIACYCHQLARRHRAQDGKRASVAGVQGHPRNPGTSDHDLRGPASRPTVAAGCRHCGHLCRHIHRLARDLRRAIAAGDPSTSAGHHGPSRTREAHR